MYDKNAMLLQKSTMSKTYLFLIIIFVSFIHVQYKCVGEREREREREREIPSMQIYKFEHVLDMYIKHNVNNFALLINADW